MARAKRSAIGHVPDGYRGIALLRDADGKVIERPISLDEAILNISDGLIQYLDEIHCTDEFLQLLATYCMNRLEARSRAKSLGGGAILGPASSWHVI